MNINSKLRRKLKLQNAFFIIALLCVVYSLAWLSLEYEFAADWTSNNDNTPSDSTLRLLEKIEDPIYITAFVSNNNTVHKRRILELVGSYQRFKENIILTFIDPSQNPEIIREKSIRFDGELILKLNDYEEKLEILTEKKLTNAIQRIARTEERWILFLEGHDERSPYGDSSFDFSSWAQILKSKGLNARGYNLASNSNIPINTSLLVIADPQKNLLHGEIQILLSYIEHGGNLLWLMEPENNQSTEFQGMEELAETLGIELVPGMVVDPNTQLLGINDPRFTLIPEYPKNPITENFDTMSIFPTSKAIEFFGSEDWESEVLLETLPRSWSETDDTTGDIQLDIGQDIPGPLIIGYSLSRDILPEDEKIQPERLILESELIDEEDVDSENKEQRIVVIGDSDFVSDAYIGEAGNMDFAMNVVNWLVKDESFINIPTKIRNDLRLELNQTQQIVIGVGFLILIPFSLLGCGLFIWLRRRNR